MNGMIVVLSARLPTTYTERASKESRGASSSERPLSEDAKKARLKNRRPVSTFHDRPRRGSEGSTVGRPFPDTHEASLSSTAVVRVPTRSGKRDYRALFGRPFSLSSRAASFPSPAYCASRISATDCSRCRTDLNASGAAARARPTHTPSRTSGCDAGGCAPFRRGFAAEAKPREDALHASENIVARHVSDVS